MPDPCFDWHNTPRGVQHLTDSSEYAASVALGLTEASNACSANVARGTAQCHQSSGDRLLKVSNVGPVFLAGDNNHTCIVQS